MNAKSLIYDQAWNPLMKLWALGFEQLNTQEVVVYPYVNSIMNIKGLQLVITKIHMSHVFLQSGWYK